MSERETLADIVADLRGRADCAERHGDRETHNDGVAMFLRSIADRIEAIDSADAWRSLYTPGNAAAMREALVAIRKALLLDSCMGPHTAFHVEVDRLTTTALSAPARQCDVGTAEDQFDRFAKHCDGSCEYGIRGRSHAHCSLVWAQTPYVAEEGGAE